MEILPVINGIRNNNLPECGLEIIQSASLLNRLPDLAAHLFCQIVSIVRAVAAISCTGIVPRLTPFTSGDNVYPACCYCCLVSPFANCLSMEGRCLILAGTK